MRQLLATLLLVPVLASGQVPIRPPDRERPATRPAPVPRPRPDAQRPANPPASTTPGVPPRASTDDDEDESPAAATPSAEGSATTQRAGRGDRCVPLRGRFMLAFNKADIVDVIEQASRWTCRNFIYTDEIARGKITLLSKTAVTSDEAYAAFLAALAANNVSVYPTGKYYKLIRTADAKKFPIPTYTDGARAPGVEQPVTKVIRLQSADADQLRGILGNFISPQGADIQSIPPDTLIITDIGLNLRRLERMIDSIDRAGAGDTIRLVQIRYASAKEVADKINQIFTGSGGGAGAAANIPRATRRTPTSTARPGQPATAARGGDGQVTKVIPDERTNKLIIVGDEKSFERIQELIEQLDIPTSAEGGIHVVFLKNASAEDLAETLSNLAQGVATARRPGAGAAGGAGGPAGYQPPAMPGVSPTTAPAAARTSAATAEILGDVKITADKQQNALIVQASGSDFAAIQRLIEKLDRPRRQVFVEAVIMEVNLRDDLELGVSAHGVVPVRYRGDDAGIPIASNPTNRFTSFNLQSIVGLGGFLTGFAGPVSAELRSLGINLPSLGVLVQALQSSSDVNVLSTPHLLASDNEESEISVGQNVPFPAGAAPNLGNLLNQGGAASGLGSLIGTAGLSGLYQPIQRQNVELRLKIKPQINEGDNVRLTIEEQTEEIAGTDPTLGPTTARRTLKTQIIAKDQSTIVMGGMVQERNTRSVRKIPLLGSLPIVGFLFRDNVTSKTKTNLLLFLTPYIIRDEADYRRIYEKKRKEYDEFVEQFYGRQPAYRVDVDFARKAGPYARIRRGVAEEALKLENGGPGTPDERLQVPPSSRPFGGGQPPADGAEPEPAPEEGEPAAPEGLPADAPPPVQPPIPPGVVPEGTEGAEPPPETPQPSPDATEDR
jgi:general secretion pathway protein D